MLNKIFIEKNLHEKKYYGKKNQVEKKIIIEKNVHQKKY